MAFVHSKNTELWLDGRDISTYFNEIGLEAENDLAETTTFKRDWKTHIPGVSGLTVEGGGFYDPDFTPDLEALLTATAGSVLTVGPAGLTVGQRARLVSVRQQAYEESSSVGDAVGFSWGVLADGPVGYGFALTSLVAVTIDGNGTSVDNGAATTTGAVAHLHVTSVSASDSIVVTIEDSANNIAWATIGTFASKAAVGAERLVIAGTIRRYVRAVDDVTGAAVSIIRGVALART